MTYQQMLQELDSIPMFGNAAGLSNLSAYLEYLNHPEAKLRVIHVAGTNGKGSVCAFLESIFRNAGYTTGLFTSPHLNRINERIRFNFEDCDDEEMADAWKTVKDAIERREELGLKMLTYFEVLFLMAMLLFEKKKPDICIVETGLGGRLDATVLTNPILSILTSISLDHMAILGDTIEKIAEEKAGIIKKDVPVVVLKQDESAWKVIKDRAEKVEAPLYEIEEKDLFLLKKGINTIDFSIENRYYSCGFMTMHSIAKYQMENAAVAAISAKLVEKSLTKEQIADGIEKMRWPGRMEEVVPNLYVDGAHNPGAIAEIGQIVKDNPGKWNLLFAVCQDKDYHTMIGMLQSFPWKSIAVTHFEGSRAAKIKEIYEEMKVGATCEVVYCEDVEQALIQIKRCEEHPLLCLGSLYLVGEIKERLQERQ